MKNLIAFCGLDCELCEAYIATKNNDDRLRRKVAKEWSELNHVEITPQMINCQGCRVDGLKTPFCQSMCPIRQCAMGRKVGTCAECGEKKACGKLTMITESSELAKANLGLGSDS